MSEWKCCKNVGSDKFEPCNRKAKTFYKHGEDICSYCEEHDYCCGEQINATETLEEYHESIKNGEIEIIWEPKQ